MTIIEGTEDIGYRANAPETYNAAFTRQRLRLPEFLAPENQDKFARALRIGQSLYLDAHVNPPDSNWAIDRTDSTPARRLAANVASALAASDGLVWLYGESARWWPGGKEGSQTWPQKLPGAINALRRAKDPQGYARAFFDSTKTPTNLLPDGDFAQTDGKAPTGWFTWQEEDSTGAFQCANGQLKISDAKSAVAGCLVKVAPGEVYAVRLRVKSQGRGLGALSIGWKTADSKWTAQSYNASFVASAPPDAQGWQNITGLVEVPRGAGQIVFMTSASAQQSQNDHSTFADALLVLVPLEE